MERMKRKARVEIVGDGALTIVEARCLIQAAMTGRFTAVMPGDVHNVESACEKISDGLIYAGQDRELVQKLLSE